MSGECASCNLLSSIGDESNALKNPERKNISCNIILDKETDPNVFQTTFTYFFFVSPAVNTTSNYLEIMNGRVFVVHATNQAFDCVRTRKSFI